MYLGVDESNRGGFPEVFVGAFSPETCFVQPGCYDKQRRKSNRSFRGIPFAYLLFTEANTKGMHKNDYTVVAVCEFIQHVNESQHINKVFVDGVLSRKQRTIIDYFIFDKGIKTNVYSEKELDKTNCLVNEADNLANFILRQEKSGEKLNGHITSRRLEPNIKDYRAYLF